MNPDTTIIATAGVELVAITKDDFERLNSEAEKAEAVRQTNERLVHELNELNFELEDKDIVFSAMKNSRDEWAELFDGATDENAAQMLKNGELVAKLADAEKTIEELELISVRDSVDIERRAHILDTLIASRVEPKVAAKIAGFNNVRFVKEKDDVVVNVQNPVAPSWMREDGTVFTAVISN